MTIIYRKEGASWPLIHVLEFRFDDVEDNRDSILIIVSDNALVCICAVAADDSILLASKLGWMVRGDVTFNLLLLHLNVLLLLLVSHDEPTVRHQRVG